MFHITVELLTLTSRRAADGGRLTGSRPRTEPPCWAAEMTDSCLSSSDDGARPQREELREKDTSDWSMLLRVGVEQEVSETAGVGGAVMSSECEDSGVLAPPAASSPSLFLLLFFFGLSSGMMSE